MTAEKLKPNPDPIDVNITAARSSPPTCLINWNARELTLDCATVRDLAAAMTTAAARAEAEAAVVTTLRDGQANDELLSWLLFHMRAHYDPRVLGTKGLLTLVPSVSVFDGTPFVHANVPPYEPSRWPPDELRGTAADWLQIAEAAERDAILTYALTDATDLTHDDIERVFATMRNVRPEGLKDTST